MPAATGNSASPSTDGMAGSMLEATTGLLMPWSALLVKENVLLGENHTTWVAIPWHAMSVLLVTPYFSQTSCAISASMRASSPPLLAHFATGHAPLEYACKFTQVKTQMLGF